MTHRLRHTIRDNLTNEDLPHTLNNQEISLAPSKLVPQLLMDMILCDARAYSIKFMATRKKEDNMTKHRKNLELEDAITLLELDNGQDKQTTNELIDKVNTLRQTIQAQADFEEKEAAKRFMANKNL